MGRDRKLGGSYLLSTSASTIQPIAYSALQPTHRAGEGAAALPHSVHAREASGFPSVIALWPRHVRFRFCC